MPIIIPQSTHQRFIFPYVEHSTSYRYVHYNPELTKFRLTMKSLDSFFVSLHKVTAYEFTHLAKVQSALLYAFLPLVIILLVFGILLGLNYKGNTEPFMVRLSLGFIFGASGLFFLWVIFILIRAKVMKDALKRRIQSVITETALSFAQAKVKWVMPNLDFPYWLELWIDDGAGFPDYTVNITSPSTGAPPNEKVSAVQCNISMSNQNLLTVPDMVDGKLMSPRREDTVMSSGGEVPNNRIDLIVR